MVSKIISVVITLSDFYQKKKKFKQGLRIWKL